METKDSLKALEKGLVVLETIKEAEQPIGVNEISRQCDMNPPTVFRILQMLKRRNWVYQDRNDKYIVGPRISFVTSKNNFYSALKEIAYFSMARLSAIESRAMNLAVRENEKCIILQQSRTNKIMDYVPPIGSYLPIHTSACGKVLMSELPEPLLEQILSCSELRAMTLHSITDRTQYLAELLRVRAQGYALDMQESQENGICLAVPIRSPQGEIFAALSFSGFIGQSLPQNVDHYLALLHQAASEISRALFDAHPDL